MFYKSGILIFIFAENISCKTVYMPTPCWLKHLCSIRALVSMSLFLFLSLSLRPFLWSTEALWVHFPAQASKTLSRRRSVPSPHQEGIWGLLEQSKPHARGFIGFLCKSRNINLFLSSIFLTVTFFLYLSLYLYISLADAVHSLDTLDPTRAGPR